jgi:hypothetical protein
MLPVEQPFKTYTGLDGKPLNNGSVYFGVAGMDPITHPITVYWDASGTLPASQPLRTINGYIVNDSDAPANVFCGVSYSETVIDSKGREVFYAPTSDDFSISTIVLNFIANLASSIGSSLIGFLQAGVGAVKGWTQDRLRLTVHLWDFLSDAQRADVMSGAGALDCTAALQAAHDHAASLYGVANGFGRGGAVVELPYGAIRFTTLTRANGVSLRGQGRYRTLLLMSQSGGIGFKSAAATSQLSADTVGWIEDAEYSLVPNPAVAFNASTVLWDMTGFTRCTFRNLAFGFKGNVTAVRMKGATPAGSGGPSQWYNTFYDVFNEGDGTGGLGWDLGDTDAGKEQITTWTWFGGRTSGPGSGTGMRLRGTGNRLYGHTFEGLSEAFDVGSSGTRGATANTLVGCYWEGNTINRHVRSNASYTKFIGSFVTGGTDTLETSDVLIDDLGDYTRWLPGGGRWEINLQNGGAKRPTIKGSTSPGIDLVDSASNMVTLYSVPQSSAGWNYLNAAINGMTASLWESGTSGFSPGDDNLKVLGRASYRWSTVYAGTGSINTSDARSKQEIRALSDAERAVAMRLKSLIRAFKFNDAVALKGSAARMHVGIIAQDVKAAFEAEGLVAEDYGMLCYDEWEAEPAMTDADGNVIREAAIAGDRYGVRYEELLAFIISAI